VTWRAATDDVRVTGYRVYRSGRYLKTLPATARRFVSTGLRKGTKRTFRVVALDAAGHRGPSTPVSARAR
jgi:hypothetical protein